MDTSPPSPPLLTTATTFFNNNAAAVTATATPSPNNIIISPPQQQQILHSSSSSTLSSIVIVIIIIASAIIISALIYLLLRFISRRFNRVQSVHSFSSSNNDVVSEFPDHNGTREHHVIHFVNNGNSSNTNFNKPNSLPVFTFSSLTGNIPGGDCAVCLSKFNGVDQLRLLPLCCHAFHVECIDMWLKTNQSCPLCRSAVNPSEDDVLNKIRSLSDQNNSFRIEIGSISRRRNPDDSGDRRSFSVGGSFEYVLDDGYEVPVESINRREISDRIAGDKDLFTPELPGENLAEEIDAGSGRRNWLRDYVDRVSVSISSRSHSFRGSGRFFTGSSRRSEVVDDYEGGRVGEEISELFRWLSGV
ncbi:E3 ubiquitin-protein ligase ATL4-like [Rutidosis leptorrhynchoides]|uniref:E3 ubiquitin-protein ligase ATL4-like n=1 Tax=Rutidosis leptorrhynchoides TaxID=125765 RepID=UPI003A992A52